MWNLKYDTWTYQWKRIRLRQTEQTCGYQGGGGVQGGIDWEFGVSRCKVLYIYIMDRQQGPTIEYRDLYSISSDKP